MTRIFIVDDHPMVRTGLSLFLSTIEDITVCGQADDANKAIASINECRPDIVIIDIGLKGISGIDLIRAVKSRYNNIEVLVFTLYDDQDYVERAIRAGAMGYVLKSDDENHLVDAIKSIIDKKAYLTSSLRDMMIEHMLWRGTDNNDPINNLTNRELEVYRLIGRGFNTRQIAHELNLTISTIGTYRERIKTKLRIRSPHELTLRAMRSSMVDEQDSPQDGNSILL